MDRLKIVLSIVLVLAISYVANGHIDNEHFDRRALHGHAEPAKGAPDAQSGHAEPAKDAPSAKSGHPKPAMTAPSAPSGHAEPAMGAPGALAEDAPGATIFDISKQPGAKGDGKVDVTAQINKAWTEACQSKTPAKMLIPQGDWLAGELTFEGPCASPGPIVIELQGTLRATPDLGAFKGPEWINIHRSSVHMMGGGIIHGQGEMVWKNKKPGAKGFADSLSFHQAPNCSIDNIHLVNSKGINMKVVDCDYFKANMVNISCPAESPNTDGIHVGRNKGLSIINSVIGSGDDCISFGDESTDCIISNITCGPGHGISIGSLGGSPGEKDVRNVAISNITFRNTDNGARIKTKRNSVVLQVTNISFTDVIMENVTNPIIIDQNYFASSAVPSKVKISAVTYKNFKGTTNSIEAITLNCSQAVPCEGLSFTDIDLTYIGKDPKKKELVSVCDNAKPTFAGKMNPPGCK